MAPSPLNLDPRWPPGPSTWSHKNAQFVWEVLQKPANRVGGLSKMAIALTDSYFVVKFNRTCCQPGPQDTLGTPKCPQDPTSEPSTWSQDGPQTPQLGDKMAPRHPNLEPRMGLGFVLGASWSQETRTRLCHGGLQGQLLLQTE